MPAVCFLWHYPAGHPGWLLATALLYGARTFLDPPASRRYRGRPVGSSAPMILGDRRGREVTRAAKLRPQSSMRTTMTSLSSA